MKIDNSIRFVELCSPGNHEQPSCDHVKKTDPRPKLAQIRIGRQTKNKFLTAHYAVESNQF